MVGTDHPRFTTVAADGGSWEVTVDLTEWTALFSAGTVKRVEIAILPTLKNGDGETLALNAPSRTFDLAANAFADDFYSPIAKVVDGCNNCHEALATTFHEPDHGGNLVVCRMCHITSNVSLRVYRPRHRRAAIHQQSTLLACKVAKRTMIA